MLDVSLPVVIQGGMGMAVSSWRLASAVAQAGQLGVVSGVALDSVLARRLQDGDPDGDIRRALGHFPAPGMVAPVLERYFLPAGRAAGVPYLPVPKLSLTPTVAQQHLTILGNFVEVWLAKEGHEGLVGINYMEKVQLATPAAMLGALLARCDYVLMGAGIPREIPQLLRDLATGQVGTITIEVQGSDAVHTLSVDPVALLGDALPPLTRPQFLAIVSSQMLAYYLARDEDIRPDGFVIEGPTAGGHSAPPRGRMTLDDSDQPIYGERDNPDLTKIASLGLPFWLAGGYGSPERVRAAVAAGAAGVQVGTLFALSRESGVTEPLREQLVRRLDDSELTVHNSAATSPTGFPFKVAQLPGSLSDPAATAARTRLCDLSYLREAYERPDGSIGFRCPAEPVHMYVRKGGAEADTLGRACLCNALTATVGLGQTRSSGYVELPLVTLGSDITGASELRRENPQGWGAAEAVDWLTTEVSEGSPAQ
ncbi:nitronate monooxygenase [Glaciihabitans tibetensis]|uniref:Nitronate monooxygenase n=1 Tax=Glaciihabitans tibetensis TaxID=1266600 RepID=A0A2T0VFJ4_9MICO|nr:nitronate monooxygenase [Glaciihabitans tibetensis]PRY68980.1 nitronate monooxygenase [Glaciihabitans tibetensis]